MDPDLDVPARGLRHASTVAKVACSIADRDGIVARLARELLDRITELTWQVKAIEKELVTTLRPRC